MAVGGIGIHAPEVILKGDLYALRHELIYYQALGFSSVELSPHIFGTIYNGSLNRKNVTELIAELKEFSFEYIIAIPDSVNFMAPHSDRLDHQVFLSCLEFAALLGRSPLVIYQAGHSQEPLTENQQKTLWERERALLSSLGEIAKSYGVLIAIENCAAYADIDHYSYAESLDRLINMAAAVNQIQVGVSLDIGRAWLAQRRHSFDLTQQLTASIPYLMHVAVNDNFGKCSLYAQHDYDNLAVTGCGDLQLPPGMGEIPLTSLLSLLGDYQGTLTLRLNAHHRQHFGYALQKLQSAAGMIKAVNF